MGKVSYKTRPSKQTHSFLTDRPEYLHEFHRLNREVTFWQGQSQYWLANEARRRATCLMQGDLPEYLKQVHSEHLFVATKRLQQEERRMRVHTGTPPEKIPTPEPIWKGSWSQRVTPTHSFKT